MNKTLSASSLSTLLQCPRKFYYSHELGWAPESEAPALTFGKEWHSFLEWITNECCLNDIVLENPTFHEMVNAYTDMWENCEELDSTTLCQIMAMMYSYEDSWREIGWVKQSEKEFAFRIPGTRWKAVGFIDAIDADGNIVEYKTTSRDIAEGSFYWLRLKYNLQAITYSLAVPNSQYVRYSVARKPSLKRKQVPLVDENGLKWVTDLSTNERAFLKNGSPRQAGGDGFRLETRTEEDEEYFSRLMEEYRNTNHFAVKDVTISTEAKVEVVKNYYAAAKCIDRLRNQSKKEHREDTLWTRNCTEFNCINCPYQGLCLDVDYNPVHGVPSGFVKK